MNLTPLKNLYNGFCLRQPTGNNAFSFDQRKNKELFVAPLISAGLDRLEVGSKIAFSEIEDGVEVNRNGLETFLYLDWAGKPVFIFDNHNHAFCFWYAALQQLDGFGGLPLVHIDQHKDTRTPKVLFDVPTQQNGGIEAAFKYTNEVLNVGNFIVPAMEAGFWSDLEIIDSNSGFLQAPSGPCALDLDIDIFSEDMAYIDNELKLDKICAWIEVAELITIATSPFFIDQYVAIEQIKEIFQRL